MLKLYFSNVSTTISTLLILVFAVFFALIINFRASINHWGWMTLVVFLLGLAMSIVSGIKDGMGTATAVFQNKNWVTIVLSVLGGICFIAGALALFRRNQAYWQISFYLLSSIIILKVLLTETFRIIHYLSK